MKTSQLKALKLEMLGVASMRGWAKALGLSHVGTQAFVKDEIANRAVAILAIVHGHAARAYKIGAWRGK